MVKMFGVDNGKAKQPQNGGRCKRKYIKKKKRDGS
jgi:hypothetical protein